MKILSKKRFARVKKNLKLSWGRAWALRSHFISSGLKRAAQTFLSERQQRLAFVLGTGRSGTQLVSGLLAQSGDVLVFHEPNFNEDVGAMDELRKDHALLVRYWKDFRCTEIYRRWIKMPSAKLYCEVNGTIRYQAKVIKEIYPNSTILLLSRDGRGVVRSVMGWPQFYSETSMGAFALAPLPRDPFFAEWANMTRFEKICWSWRDTNEFLMSVVPREQWVQLELLTTDFDYFTERFSKPLGLVIPHSVWATVVTSKSKNASKTYKFPDWREWSSDEKRSFTRICGKTMEKLGYTV